MSAKTERTAMPGPMAGIRVVDLSAVVSGPMAAGMLADQGADVIKVESRAGDLTRRIGPARGDLTSTFASINRGKRSIVLDLKQLAAREVLRELVASADVLVENFRPGAMARLGFAYEDVRAYNPRIVYLSISGFGQDGPYSGQRVYDPVIQAVSGFADAHPDPTTGEPQSLPTVLCDKITALTAAQALAAALHARHATGEGRRIELSMLDAAVSFLWPEAFYNHALLDVPPQPVPEFGASQRLWRCRDGWFAMTTPQDDEFAAMCRAFGTPELIGDARFDTIPKRRANHPALRTILEPIAAQQDVDPFVARLAAEGVPAGKVNRKHELADDPQVRHNGTLVDVEYPGIGRVRTPRPAATFSGDSPDAAQRRAPGLGEHTRAILRELGRDDVRIAALFASGAAG